MKKLILFVLMLLINFNIPIAAADETKKEEIKAVEKEILQKCSEIGNSLEKNIVVEEISGISINALYYLRNKNRWLEYGTGTLLEGPNAPDGIVRMIINELNYYKECLFKDGLMIRDSCIIYDNKGNIPKGLYCKEGKLNGKFEGERSDFNFVKKYKNGRLIRAEYYYPTERQLYSLYLYKDGKEQRTYFDKQGNVKSPPNIDNVEFFE